MINAKISLLLVKFLSDARAQSLQNTAKTHLRVDNLKSTFEARAAEHVNRLKS
jgi:hypothetical protein